MKKFNDNENIFLEFNKKKTLGINLIKSGIVSQRKSLFENINQPNKENIKKEINLPKISSENILFPEILKLAIKNQLYIINLKKVKKRLQKRLRRGQRDILYFQKSNNKKEKKVLEDKWVLYIGVFFFVLLPLVFLKMVFNLKRVFKVLSRFFYKKT